MACGSAAPSRPGIRPASASAIWPATRPNWLNRSSWRAVFGGMNPVQLEFIDLRRDLSSGTPTGRSGRYGGRASGRPGRPPQKASRPTPMAVITPIPVIQTRREESAVGHGEWFVRGGSAELICRDAEWRKEPARGRLFDRNRFRQCLERGQGPTRDRAREEAVNERRPQPGAE